jgi:hypothetical protein
VPEGAQVIVVAKSSPSPGTAVEVSGRDLH